MGMSPKGAIQGSILSELFIYFIYIYIYEIITNNCLR